MSVVNVAYGLLSDPVKRAEHDRWIAAEESPQARPMRHGTTLHAPSPGSPGSAAKSPQARQAALDKRMRGVRSHLIRHRIAYSLAVVALFGLGVAGIELLLAPGLRIPAADSGVVLQPLADYARPGSAPNGRAWPTVSGYVEGFPELNMGGQAEVLVDNADNDADMFAKLFALDGPAPTPVRTFFVAAHTRFLLSQVVSGTYDLRYRNLRSGTLARSPALILEDVRTAHGVQHGSATVKLYGSAAGNMRSYSLPESDF